MSTRYLTDLCEWMFMYIDGEEGPAMLQRHYLGHLKDWEQIIPNPREGEPFTLRMLLDQYRDF